MRRVGYLLGVVMLGVSVIVGGGALWWWALLGMSKNVGTAHLATAFILFITGGSLIALNPHDDYT